MEKMEQEVALIFPEGKAVTLKGKSYTVMPFSFVKFPKVLKLFKGLDFKSTGALDLMDLVADNGDKVVDLVTLALDIDAKELEGIPMDEGFEVVKVILEVNGDFFVKRLLPKVSQVMEALTGLVGASLSQDSLPPATASTK